MNSGTPRVAAVIPYFQREKGVLRRAAASVLAQRDVDAFPIVVVDDASPVPARDDLAELIESHPGRIRIIEQANAGPGVARNTGLDHVAIGTRYVAFLDSDDEWGESHLANALAGLEQGFDFYFSNYLPLNESRPIFELRGLRVDRHRRLFPAKALYRYRTDFFDDVLREGLVGTSTVVYRFEKFSDMRFPLDLVSSGEDNYLWLEFALNTDRIVFSGDVEVTYGFGVNIFARSGWGSDGAMSRIHSDLRFRQALLRRFALTPAQEEHTRKIIRRHRTEFLENLIHRLHHRKPVDLRLVGSYFRVDPLAVPGIVPVLVRAALRKLDAR